VVQNYFILNSVEDTNVNGIFITVILNSISWAFVTRALHFQHTPVTYIAGLVDHDGTDVSRSQTFDKFL
jgi:hypothetical protein